MKFEDLVMSINTNMGKKSRTAGTTKYRTRICDKQAHRTELDKARASFNKLSVKGNSLKVVSSIIKDMTTFLDYDKGGLKVNYITRDIIE